MLQHLRDIQSHPAPPSISKGDAERMPIYFHRQRKMVKTNDDNGIYGATKKANCHAEQVKRQERIEQGTLNSFLNDGENGTTHRARRTSHLLDIRKKANQAVDEAAIANGLLTRSQKQKQSLNITFMAGRAAKFARKRVEKRNMNMSPIFSVRRNKILRRRREEMNALKHHQNKKINDGVGIEHTMVTSAGLHDLEIKEKAYKKKMKISKAKHKLKSFTRALVASGSNLKYYFKNKKKNDDIHDIDTHSNTIKTDGGDSNGTHFSDITVSNFLQKLKNSGGTKNKEEDGERKNTENTTEGNIDKDDVIIINEKEFHQLAKQRQQDFFKLCSKYSILPEPIIITLEEDNEASSPSYTTAPRKRRVLKIPYRSLSNDIIIALGQSLQKNDLDEIDVSGNCMTEKGLEALISVQIGK